MANRSNSGRSRAKGSSRARGSRSAGASSSRQAGGSGRRGVSQGYDGNSGSGFSRVAVGGVLLIVVIAVIAGILKGMGGAGAATEETVAETAETETVTEQETELLTSVSVGGVDITGLSRADAEKKLDESMPWSMTVTYDGQVYTVSNLIAEKIHSILDQVYSGIPEETYELDASGLEASAAREAAAAAGQWDRKAKNGSIDSYDADSDKFIFSGAQTGLQVDQEKLAADILSAVKEKNYGAEIEASVSEVEPDFTEAAAKEKYKTVSSFTTQTTANEKRNTNIKLAAKAINGTVLQPGEEFSFNNTVGERTEAKGYQGAAAYNNGEVVQEIGGGVCQVSSTLYNAVVKAGLKTTSRQSHTFEPNYVTPGTDATVSWGGPDYRFVNNSSAAVGIRASYASRELTVSIYAVPVLEEGETHTLKSTKIKDYTTGTEEEQNSGLQSIWETRLVITKNGEVVSQNVDHKTTYKSHTTANERAEAESIKAAEEAARLASEAAASEAETIEASTAEGESGSGPVESTQAAAAPGSGTVSGGPGEAGEQQTTAEPIPSPTESESTVAAPGASSQATVAPGPGSSGQTAAAAPGTSDSQTSGADGGTVETIAPMPGA